MPFDGTNFEQQDEVLDLLRRGREMIARPGGWGQHTSKCGDAVCVLGAISQDYGDATETEISASYCLSIALAKILHINIIDSFFERAVEYNDTPGRTQAEIVALYDRAIALRDTPENG